MEGLLEGLVVESKSIRRGRKGRRKTWGGVGGEEERGSAGES